MPLVLTLHCLVFR